MLFALCHSPTHGIQPGHAAGIPGNSEMTPRDYREGPVALRLGGPGAILVPEGCRVRCAGSTYAEIDCGGTLLEARSPAVLWPDPQNEERLQDGGILQWAQYGDDFLGVLVATESHFALLQRRCTEVGRSLILELLRSHHSPTPREAQVDCPMVIADHLLRGGAPSNKTMNQPKRRD